MISDAKICFITLPEQVSLPKEKGKKRVAKVYD